MDNAFSPGDPALEVAGVEYGKHHYHHDEHWVVRDEQEKLNSIIQGKSGGHYYLIIGEKGTGKTSMLLEAMRKTNGDGVAMFEAHGDLEIFRIRLGKALDFEFHEDYIGSLFSIRGPRDTTALLDIERAFNKLEKVALARRRKGAAPLVLVVNSTHLVRDDHDGQDLLEMIQQRAEQWAASSLVTTVFNSDDYWVYERLKRYATRMEVIPVCDLPKSQAMAALKRYRKQYFDEDLSDQSLETIYDKVGGRLSFLNRVAKARDYTKLCDSICEAEKTWFLNKCWILGEDMDDDVMDQQKYAVRLQFNNKSTWLG
jgi:AAA+ ATPase superfamily predicted ATPase